LLLFNKTPLTVNCELAMLIGLNESIVVQQIHYWIRKNQENNINYYDGYYWTYNTYADWQKQFPFWCERTIKRIFLSLERKNILISDNFNQMKRDRTKWYRINYEALNQLYLQATEKPHNSESGQNGSTGRKPRKLRGHASEQIGTMHQINFTPSIGTNCHYGTGQVDPMGGDKLSPPLPETNTEITTETNNNNITGTRYRVPEEKTKNPIDDDVVEPRGNSTLDNVINSQSVKTAAAKEQHPQHSLTDYPKLHCKKISPFSDRAMQSREDEQSEEIREFWPQLAQEINRVRSFLRDNGIRLEVNRKADNACYELAKYSNEQLAVLAQELLAREAKGEILNASGLLVSAPGVIAYILKGPFNNSFNHARSFFDGRGREAQIKAKEDKYRDIYVT
jgi:hypothetical protein